MWISLSTSGTKHPAIWMPLSIGILIKAKYDNLAGADKQAKSEYDINIPIEKTAETLMEKVSDEIPQDYLDGLKGAAAKKMAIYRLLFCRPCWKNEATKQDRHIDSAMRRYRLALVCENGNEAAIGGRGR